MAVGTYALTTVEKLKSFMGLGANSPQISAFEIWSAQGDATAATVEVTATGITLIITGGVNAGTDTITWAAQATVTALLAAITALAKNWEHTQICAGAADSDDMVKLEATACLTAANRITVQIADDYRFELIIDSMTAAIETYCQRQFMSRDYAVWVDGQEGPFLALDNYPVTAVSRLSISAVDALQVRMTGTAQVATVSVTTAAVVLTSVASGVSTTATVTFAAAVTLTAMAAAINALGTGWQAQIIAAYGPFASADLRPIGARDALNGYQALELPWTPEDRYKIKLAEGLLYGPDFGGGVETVYVAYTGGYVTVPADLEQTMWLVCKEAYDVAQRDASLNSERLGDYSWSAALGVSLAQSVLRKHLAELDRWRRWM